jgi:hypothetical protein
VFLCRMPSIGITGGILRDSRGCISVHGDRVFSDFGTASWGKQQKCVSQSVGLIRQVLRRFQCITHASGSLAEMPCHRSPRSGGTQLAAGFPLHIARRGVRRQVIRPHRRLICTQLRLPGSIVAGTATG